MTRIVLAPPRRRSLVFVGDARVGLITEYVSEDDFCIYAGPRSELNIWVLLLAAVRGWWSYRGYYGAFLRLTRPRFVVTGEDNAVEFYFTKRYLPDATTLCLQNGRRDSFAHDPERNLWDILREELPSELAPDVILSHGEPWTVRYRDALRSDRCRIVNAGNIVNNAVDIGERNQARRVLFVSSFPNLGSDGDLLAVGPSLLGYWGGHPLTYRQFYEPEGVVATIAAEYAEEHGFEFGVIGKRPTNQPGERKFFEAVLNPRPWTYLPSERTGSSYLSVSPDDILVNMDSTFGYEMMSRDVRVAFVSARMTLAGLPSIRDCEFAHPYVTEATGPFWTNRASREEVFRVLDAVTHRPNRELCTEIGLDMGTIFAFDRGNEKLCEILGELGIRHSGAGVVGLSQIPGN